MLSRRIMVKKFPEICQTTLSGILAKKVFKILRAAGINKGNPYILSQNELFFSYIKVSDRKSGFSFSVLRMRQTIRPKVSMYRKP